MDQEDYEPRPGQELSIRPAHSVCFDLFPRPCFAGSKYQKHSRCTGRRILTRTEPIVRRKRKGKKIRRDLLRSLRTTTLHGRSTLLRPFCIRRLETPGLKPGAIGGER